MLLYIYKLTKDKKMKYTIQTHNVHFDNADQQVVELWLKFFQKGEKILMDLTKEEVNVYRDNECGKWNPFFFGFPIKNLSDYFRVKQLIKKYYFIELAEDEEEGMLFIRINDETAVSDVLSAGVLSIV